jgi:putative Mg2+ transporter-C (MgtC) family protein
VAVSALVLSSANPLAGSLGISGGQGWLQLGELGLAFVLSALIGMERQVRQKAAGLRTHTLVGVAAALMMLVSKYGFSDVLVPGHIILDPSRVAAQIVSGVGFIGAGLIFVRKDAVRGLTTAAVVWLVAGIGMACGGGLAGLAVAVTGMYFAVMYLLPWLAGRVPRMAITTSTLQIEYTDGRGALRRVLEICTSQRFRVGEVNISSDSSDRFPEGNGLAHGGDTSRAHGGDTSRAHGGDTSRARDGDTSLADRVVSVALALSGRGSVTDLAARLQEIDGVRAVRAADSDPSR